MSKRKTLKEKRREMNSFEEEETINELGNLAAYMSNTQMHRKTVQTRREGSASPSKPTER